MRIEGQIYGEVKDLKFSAGEDAKYTAVGEYLCSFGKPDGMLIFFPSRILLRGHLCTGNC